MLIWQSGKLLALLHTVIYTINMWRNITNAVASIWGTRAHWMIWRVWKWGESFAGSVTSHLLGDLHILWYAPFIQQMWVWHRSNEECSISVKHLHMRQLFLVSELWHTWFYSLYTTDKPQKYWQNDQIEFQVPVSPSLSRLPTRMHWVFFCRVSSSCLFMDFISCVSVGCSVALTNVSYYLAYTQLSHQLT